LYVVSLCYAFCFGVYLLRTYRLTAIFNINKKKSSFLKYSFKRNSSTSLLSESEIHEASTELISEIEKQKGKIQVNFQLKILLLIFIFHIVSTLIFNFADPYLRSNCTVGPSNIFYFLSIQVIIYAIIMIALLIPMRVVSDAFSIAKELRLSALILVICAVIYIVAAQYNQIQLDSFIFFFGDGVFANPDCNLAINRFLYPTKLLFSKYFQDRF